METDRNEPSGWWVGCGTVAILTIISCIVLITAAATLTINWKVGYSIVLVIIGLVAARVTFFKLRNWLLFLDTAIESSGKVVQRIHTQHEDDYGRPQHKYSLVVQFMKGQTPIRLREEVNERRYVATREGSSLLVRFAPSKPELARFKWEPESLQKSQQRTPEPPLPQTQTMQLTSTLISPTPVLIRGNDLIGSIHVRKLGEAFREVFAKGTALPFHIEEIFSIGASREILQISAVQEDVSDDNQYLTIGNFDVLLLNQPQGEMDVEITYRVSQDGRFSIEANDVAGIKRLVIIAEWPPNRATG